MKLTGRGIWLAIVIALAGSAALTAISSGHTKFYKSKVSISLAKAPQDDIASGEVDAHKKACRRGRTVILFEENKPGGTGQFLEIGRTKTDASGAWSEPIQDGIKKGRAYHAQAKAKKVRNNREHKHICKSKFSEDVLGT